MNPGPAEGTVVSQGEAELTVPGLDPVDEPELPPDVRPPRANRTIVVIAATAVLSLAAGIALSHLVISPAQRAAEAAPPEAGAITVPVEQRELSTDLTLRGDALYDDPVSVVMETAELAGPAIVTGQVPEGDRPGARQPVRLRHQHDGGLVLHQEVLDLVLVRGEHGVGEVEVAFLEHLDEAGAPRVGESQVDVRVPAGELGHRATPARRENRVGRRTDPQLQLGLARQRHRERF